MMDWASQATNLLWHNGLAALPLVLMAAAATHLLRCRPSTRHTMWLMVLLWLVLPPLLPGVSSPGAALPRSRAQESSLDSVVVARDYENSVPNALPRERIAAPSAKPSAGAWWPAM